MVEHVSLNTGEYTWNEEKCLELIRKFRMRPALWNTKNLLFYKQTEKKKIWDAIGKELNTTGAECKHKMNILLSSFRREKSKLRNNLARGNTSPFQSTWFGFNDLSFLLQRNETENASENPDDSSAEAASSINETDFNATHSRDIFFLPEENSNDLNLKTEPASDDDDELERDLGIVTTMIESATNNKMVLRPLEHPTQESMKQMQTKQQSLPTKTAHNVTNNRHEEILAFTSFVAEKMKQYSSETLSAVEKQICDILFKADREGIQDNLTSNEDSQSKSKKRKLN